MTTTATDLKSQILTAVDAAESKKAEHVAILQMEKYAFTDYLVICSGSNPRQVQAISDEIELRLKQQGAYPNSIEGFKQAEWVLLDYVDFVVHVFTEEARKFRDLERLWKSAARVTANELKSRPSRARTTPAPARRAPAIPTGARSKRVKPMKSAATGKAIRSATSRTKSPARKAASAKKKVTQRKKK
jgi:ribosome-associated protein